MRGALANNTSILNAALDAVSGKLLILDAAGRILSANQAWTRFLRRERFARPAIGKDFRTLDIVRPDDADAEGFFAGLNDIVAGLASDFSCTYRLATKKREHWFHIRAVRTGSGATSRIIVALDDVTDMHRARRAINRLSLHLSDVKQQERQRIARDLHDTTSQHLTAMSLNLMVLRQSLKRSGRAVRVLDDIEQSLESSLREVRVNSFLLYPPAIGDGGFETALDRLVQGFVRFAGVDVRLRISGGGHLDQDQQRALLLVVQEALLNIRRHAAASRALVRLKIGAGQVQLCVSDNGRGLDRTGKARPPSSGTRIGILSMQARIEELGGVFRLKSRPGRGTQILVQVPLTRNLGVVLAPLTPGIRC
jgi:two-component system, NarL family, sensor kinase